MKTVGKIIIFIGIVALTMGFGIFLFRTKTVEINTTPAIINKLTYYTKINWWDSEYYHLDEVVRPSGTTQPNTAYLLVIEFPLFQYENRVSWTQSEIDSNTQITVSNVVSHDKYVSVTPQTKYTVKYFEIKRQYNVLYLLPGIFVLGIGIFILKSSFFKSHEPDTHYEFRPPNITDSLKSTQIEQIFVYKPRDTENTIFDRQKYLDSNNKTISQQRELGSENSNGKDRIPIPNNIKHEIIQRSRNACENPDCQMKYPIHIHHIDMNRTNNSKKNLIALCPKCHKDAHNGILINSQLRNWVMADYNRLRHEREN